VTATMPATMTTAMPAVEQAAAGGVPERSSQALAVIESGAAALPSLEHLTGAQKAAIVLLKLGRDRAAQIMRLLGDRDVTRVTAEIVQAQAIRREDAEASLIEFAMLAKANDHLATGGVERARDFLEASLGGERAGEILDGLREVMARAPFEFLRRTDPRQVVNFLSGEHPQTVALVLAHLPPEQASLVLGGLDERTQREVSIRIARLEQISPEVIAQLEAVLEKRFGLSATHQAQKVDRADGVQTLIDILNRADRATERAIFEGLEQHESELVDTIRARMFVFEDIVTLDDRAIQLILRQVESRELATALKGVKGAVRDKIKRNMSERAAINLEEEISMLGAVKLSTVEEAQGTIVRTIRALEESGQIVVSRGSDEYVE
jgi:flagellar motor switch protein FliG